MFQVLNLVVTGTQGTLTPRGSATFADFLQEEDLESVRDISSVPSSPRTPMDIFPEFTSRQHRSSTNKQEMTGGIESNMLKLAARTVSTIQCYRVRYERKSSNQMSNHNNNYAFVSGDEPFGKSYGTFSNGRRCLATPYDCTRTP